MKKEKLDSLSKIMLATGAINYMAAAIDSVNEQVKTVPDKNGIHADGISERDEILSVTCGKLAEIMEDLGNLINNQDCTCPIDARSTKAAFDIVLHGKDDVNK